MNEGLLESREYGTSGQPSHQERGARAKHTPRGCLQSGLGVGLVKAEGCGRMHGQGEEREGCGPEANEPEAAGEAWNPGRKTLVSKVELRKEVYVAAGSPSQGAAGAADGVAVPSAPRADPAAAQELRRKARRVPGRQEGGCHRPREKRP